MKTKPSKEWKETPLQRQRRLKVNAHIAAECLRLGINPADYLGKDWNQ